MSKAFVKGDAGADDDDEGVGRSWVKGSQW